MHKNAVDLTGRSFGSLTVIREGGRGADRKVAWFCRCACGQEKSYRGTHLTSGASTSCGCLRGANISKAVVRHGATNTAAYSVWSSMIQRCTNPKNKRWSRYGGRGISVCERWGTFQNFLDDMGQPPPSLTLDRVNNDGDYKPGNCRWATRKVQGNNRPHPKPRDRGADGRFLAGQPHLAPAARSEMLELIVEPPVPEAA